MNARRNLENVNNLVRVCTMVVDYENFPAIGEYNYVTECEILLAMDRIVTGFV